MSNHQLLVNSQTGKFAGYELIQPDSNYKILKIEESDVFESLRDDWGLLLSQSPHQDAFLSWEWLFSWWKYFGKGSELWLVTVWADQELVGIAPLMLNKRKKFGLHFRVLCNIGIPETDVGGFIVKDDDPRIYQAICDFLVHQKRNWDLLELEEVEVSRLEKITSALKHNGFDILEAYNQHYYISIDSDWDTYFSNLPKKNRHEFRRKARRVKEASTSFTFVRHVGQEITDEDIATMFAINQCGHFPDFFESDERQQFHRDLFRLMSDKGRPEVSYLVLDGVPAAFGYGFNYANRLEMWRIGFDTAHCELSIGTVLMNLMLEECFKHNYREVDFLRGAEDYKTRWNPLSRNYANLRVAARTRLKPLLFGILIPRLARYSLKKLNRHSPFIRRKEAKEDRAC
ncbi:MAG: GNAT family N-acetyltransferase [Chloroflexota bacterium]